MAQFDVYRLPNGGLVVDVQSPFASVHQTRLVIPLVDPAQDVAIITRLNPVVTLDDGLWLLTPQFMTTIDVKLLRQRVGSVADDEWKIKSAIDFLLNGY